MGLFNIFKKKNQAFEWPEVAVAYQRFYEANKFLGLSFYGLAPLEEKGISAFHKDAYTQTLHLEFPFNAACEWDTPGKANEAAALMEQVQYGNITIAGEGCGIYWLLITTGQHKGEVWLLSEYGVTPVTENLTLEKWKEKQLESKNTFWYAAVADWGQATNDFFRLHAPVKMVDHEQSIFGVSGRICQHCVQYISQAALRQNKEYYVTDPSGTRIFDVKGDIELV